MAASMTEINDAFLVEVLKYKQNHTVAQCCTYFGRGHASIERYLSQAIEKGLTVTSVTKDEKAALKTKIKILEKEIERIQKDNDSSEAIRKEIYDLSKQIPNPPNWILAPHGQGSSGVPMTMWSDWHYG